MEIIADEKVVENHGIAVRIVRNDGMNYPFAVEQVPVSEDGSYSREDFSIFGGSVGYGTSEFDTEDKAREFFNDIVTMDSGRLAEKYPGLWVK